MLLSDWLTYANAALSAAGVESHRIEAELLAAHALGVERSVVLAHPEWETQATFESLLGRRLSGEPIAYILGYREFFGRRFAVDARVLIPRHETETLIGAWFELEHLVPRSGSVLDVGTGSGCIGVTLKLERPSLDLALSDVSDDALSVARANASTLGASVRLVSSDLFARLGSERFDAIVSNPPYIGSSETLPKEVAEFEPRSALYSGETGNEIYKRIAAEAADHLNPGGPLLMEIGYRQSSAVQDLFAAQGWNIVRVFRDLSGVERVLCFSVRPGH